METHHSVLADLFVVQRDAFNSMHLQRIIFNDFIDADGVVLSVMEIWVTRVLAPGKPKLWDHIQNYLTTPEATPEATARGGWILEEMKRLLKW